LLRYSWPFTVIKESLLKKLIFNAYIIFVELILELSATWRNFSSIEWRKQKLLLVRRCIERSLVILISNTVEGTILKSFIVIEMLLQQIFSPINLFFYFRPFRAFKRRIFLLSLWCLFLFSSKYITLLFYFCNSWFFLFFCKPSLNLFIFVKLSFKLRQTVFEFKLIPSLVSSAFFFFFRTHLSSTNSFMLFIILIRDGVLAKITYLSPWLTYFQMIIEHFGRNIKLTILTYFWSHHTNQEMRCNIIFLEFK
jgi:hypothetical protein